MTDPFKTQYVSVTNNSQPNLEQINDHIFEVFQRVEYSRKVNVPKLDSITLATNMNMKPRYDFKNGCLLCQSDNDKNSFSHKMENSKKYPSVDEKIGKLKDLNGCLKCGFINHQSKNCKYKFNEKCKNCEKDHFYYLCFSKLKNSTFVYAKGSKPSGIKN